MLNNPPQLLYFDPRLSSFLFEDFTGGGTSTTTVTDTPLATSFVRVIQGGGSAFIGSPLIAAQPETGILTLRVTAVADRAGAQGIAVGGGIRSTLGQLTFETRVRFPILSTPADRYDFKAGILDATTFPNDGYYFVYDESISPNWQIVTAKGGVFNTVITNVPVATNSHQKLKFVTNSNASEVNFYIDNVNVGTLNTFAALPLVSAALGMGAGMFRSVISGPGVVRDALLDWMTYQYIYSQNR